MGKGVSDAGTGKTPLDAAALAFLKAEFAAGRGAKPTPKVLSSRRSAWCTGERAT